jgi:SAM-dependent methyltransferase
VPRREPTPGPAAGREALEQGVRAHLEDLGRAEGARGSTRRHAQGAHYTPEPLVSWVFGTALDSTLHSMRCEATGARGLPGERVPTVLDPACGAGNFLVEAARRLAALGWPMATVLAHGVFGVDIDARAIELCRGRLLELCPNGTSSEECARVELALRRHVVVGDSLDEGPVAALRPAGAEIGGFDLVVGNPPFLNRLERATALEKRRVEALRRRHPGALGRYADAACAFLLDGVEALHPGGAVAFVMPQSFLSAAEAGATRARLLERGELTAIWSCDERLFSEAQVAVCAVCLRRNNEARGQPIARAFGADFAPVSAWTGLPPAGDEPWSPMLAEAAGVPDVSRTVAASAALSTIATATADFRDQYYGLRGAIFESDDPRRDARPMLVTTRHVDLARCAWGGVPVRVHGAAWTRPCVDRARLAGDLGMTRWLASRLVPKVLVATQTRILEAVVDAEGAWVPLVPLITVLPRDPDESALWRIASAVASPVSVAHAASHVYGSALSPGALKLSARQVLALPIPSDIARWNQSADALRHASSAASDDARCRALDDFAALSCVAYGLDPGDAARVLGFWRTRAGRAAAPPA